MREHDKCSKDHCSYPDCGCYSAFNMVVDCFVGQQPIGGSEIGLPNTCRQCGEITHYMYTRCALCKIKIELGMLPEPPQEVPTIYYG